MKKFLALSFALALTFSATVCAAETVVPEKEFDILDELAIDVEKSLPAYTSNAVADMDGVDDLAVIASGSDMVTEGSETNATCIVNKVDVTALRYAQQKAAQVGGSMLTVVNLSAPGVNLVDAQVKLAVEGVNAGDAVSVYKCVKGDWVAVDVAAVADGSVTIAFDSQGIYTLIK
ncbi:MAG: hypothetical protein K2N00_07895 [Lachnospiraceae bacterium]|nr:hypothetical protein [Lachnospiraceae bacterium]